MQTDSAMPPYIKAVFFGLLAAALLWLAGSVSGALAPFALAAVAAYVLAPLAGRLERQNVPPAVAALLLSVFSAGLLLALPFALLPLMTAQAQEIFSLLPPLMEKAQAWLGKDAGKELLAKLSENVNAAAAAAAAGTVGGWLQRGFSFVLATLTALLVTPLAMFYFLRDRESIGGELIDLLPPRLRDRALGFCRDLNAVLGEFLHAQLLVILIMMAFYSVALLFAGLPFAVTIGVASGLLVFVPYAGFALGLALATLVALAEFASFVDVAIVWALMICGTLIESFVITPRLVGERVGLHPLATLLALFVMGEWFGFLGLLAALPAAAVLLVCARHLRRQYIGSAFYR